MQSLGKPRKPAPITIDDVIGAIGIVGAIAAITITAIEKLGGINYLLVALH